jgi:hypothetical protein
VNKREPGYANLVVAQPPLKLVLFENAQAGERLNHMGFEVFSDVEVDAAAARLGSAELEHEAYADDTCCYAKQNKVVTLDPQGLMWEWYRVLEDSPGFSSESKQSAACCAGQCAT